MRFWGHTIKMVLQTLGTMPCNAMHRESKEVKKEPSDKMFAKTTCSVGFQENTKSHVERTIQ